MKICIEGNIGCGKSTIISRLCTEVRVPVFLEPVDEWKDWLAQFYQDPARWGMSFNLKVLMSFNNWSDNKFFSIYERSPVSNRYVFAQLQRDQGKMNDLELELFDALYKKLSWEPDVLIYIRTDPKVSMERMNTRGRECENTVPFEYLQAVHDKYEKVMKGQRYIVDGNRSHDLVYKDVLDIITQLKR